MGYWTQLNTQIANYKRYKPESEVEVKMLRWLKIDRVAAVVLFACAVLYLVNGITDLFVKWFVWW